MVLGKVRAKQSQRSDEERHQVMGLLLHGGRVRGPGSGHRKAWNCRSSRLSNRSDPYRREQPDRFHHASGEVAVVPVLFDIAKDRKFRSST